MRKRNNSYPTNINIFINITTCVVHRCTGPSKIHEMSLYLSFLSVLLIPTSDNDQSSERWTDFNDLNNNQMNLLNHCGLKPSVLKCCSNGENLDSDGFCRDARQFKDVFYKTNYYISAYSWNDITEELKKTKKKLSQDLVFVQNKKLAHTFETKIRQHDQVFYILEDGSLKIRTGNSTAPWLTVSPLEYCVDYYIHGSNPQTTVTFTYKLTNNSPIRFVARDKSIAVTGLLVSILLLMLETFSHMMPDAWNLRSFVCLACALSQLATFLLELIQYLQFSQGLNILGGCAVTGPTIYYFVLSNFFWAVIMHYRRLLNVQQIHRRKQKKNDSVTPENTWTRFIRYSLFAWGIPLLMTMAAFGKDKLGFRETFFYECWFANDQQIMFYVYVPVLVLTTICYILFLITTYYELVLRCMVKIKNRDENMNELRFVLVARLALTIGMAMVLRRVVDVPMLLYYAIDVYHAFMLFAVTVVTACETSVLLKPCLRFCEDSWVIQDILDFLEIIFVDVNFKFFLT